MEIEVPSWLETSYASISLVMGVVILIVGLVMVAVGIFNTISFLLIELLLTRLAKWLRIYRVLIEYAYYRKEFKMWREANKPPLFPDK